MTQHLVKDQIMFKDISRIIEVIQKSERELVPSALPSTIKGLGKWMIIKREAGMQRKRNTWYDKHHEKYICVYSHFSWKFWFQCAYQFLQLWGVTFPCSCEQMFLKFQLETPFCSWTGAKSEYNQWVSELSVSENNKLSRTVHQHLSHKKIWETDRHYWKFSKTIKDLLGG